MSAIQIPRPAKPFRVSQHASRVAIFRAHLLATATAERCAKQNRPELAARFQREALRLLAESGK
jgi:hypothetical protein